MSSALRHRAPIDALPIELLSIIFTLATHGAESTSAPTSPYEFDPHSATFPHVLASVSSRWREVAAATPALWTSVHLGAPNALEYASLDLRIARSRNALLDIYIDARDPEWDFQEEDEADPESFEYDESYEHPFPSSLMAPLLAHLLPQSRRWRSLVILTDTYAPMYAALALLSTATALDAPCLETLALMRCNEYACHGYHFSPAGFNGPPLLPFGGKRLPKLRHLTLSGVHADWDRLPQLLPSATPGEPSSGLETLELAYHALEVCPTVPEFSALLRAVPNVRQLALKASGPNFEDLEDAPEAPALLSRLERLELSYADAVDTAAMLELFDAPAVTELVLEDGTSPAEIALHNAGPVLASLAGCSPRQPSSTNNVTITDGPANATSSKGRFPRLASLTLQRVLASSTAFDNLFSSASALRHLHLEDTPDVLAALKPASASDHAAAPRACACPHLETLVVRGLPDEVLCAVRVADARAAAGVPLASVHVEPLLCDGEDEALAGEWALAAAVLAGRKDIEADEAEADMSIEAGCLSAAPSPCTSASASASETESELEEEGEGYTEEPSWRSDGMDPDARWECAQPNCEACEEWPRFSASAWSSPASSPASSPSKAHSPAKGAAWRFAPEREGDEFWVSGGTEFRVMNAAGIFERL